MSVGLDPSALISRSHALPLHHRPFTSLTLFRPLTPRRNRASSSDADRTLAPRQYVPKGPEEVVDQALGAVRRAFQDGIARQQIELLLPLIGATDLDDWPGGIRQQFKAASPMLESLVLSLKQEPQLQGPLSSEVLDQGDAVGAWTGPKLAAVLFATAETLKEVREISERIGSGGLTLLVNPQWTSGNLVSDFGIGPWRRRNEEFVASFEQTYVLKQMRISGDNIRLVRSYPSGWQIYLQREGQQQPELLTELEKRPSYKELEQLLQATEGSSAGKTWVQRIQSEFAFNRDSLDRKR